MRRVKIVMKNGETYWTSHGYGSVATVHQRIQTYRGKGQMIAFADTSTPSREFYIDPDDVSSVQPDPYD